MNMIQEFFELSVFGNLNGAVIADENIIFNNYKINLMRKSHVNFTNNQSEAVRIFEKKEEISDYKINELFLDVIALHGKNNSADNDDKDDKTLSHHRYVIVTNKNLLKITIEKEE